jgi:ssDNA-binding Zn-finger/Zn-ribbon topoisomerase 1
MVGGLAMPSVALKCEACGKLTGLTMRQFRKGDYRCARCIKKNRTAKAVSISLDKAGNVRPRAYKRRRGLPWYRVKNNGDAT